MMLKNDEKSKDLLCESGMYRIRCNEKTKILHENNIELVKKSIKNFIMFLF